MRRSRLSEATRPNWELIVPLCGCAIFWAVVLNLLF